MQSTVEMWDWEAAPVYGHLSTKKSYSPPHNNSATIDTVYLPGIVSSSSSPNKSLSILIDTLRRTSHL